MDFAFFKNGYVYHTKYDNMDMIEPGVYQSSGENLLGLIRSLSNSRDLPNASLENTAKTVYYDVLGYFFVAYSEEFSQYLNLPFVALAYFFALKGFLTIQSGSYRI